MTGVPLHGTMKTFQRFPGRDIAFSQRSEGVDLNSRSSRRSFRDQGRIGGVHFAHRRGDGETHASSLLRFDLRSYAIRECETICVWHRALGDVLIPFASGIDEP
jgi:hypothetical protein